MSKCRSCGTVIRFLQNTVTGKRIPVDPTPDDKGNLVARTIAGALVGHPLTKGEQPPNGWAIFMPHYGTCRARVRRGRGRGTPRPQTLFDGRETETR